MIDLLPILVFGAPLFFGKSRQCLGLRVAGCEGGTDCFAGVGVLKWEELR